MQQMKLPKKSMKEKIGKVVDFIGQIHL